MKIFQRNAMFCKKNNCWIWTLVDSGLRWALRFAWGVRLCTEGRWSGQATPGRRGADNRTLLADPHPPQAEGTHNKGGNRRGLGPWVGSATGGGKDAYRSRLCGRVSRDIEISIFEREKSIFSKCKWNERISLGACQNLKRELQFWQKRGVFCVWTLMSFIWTSFGRMSAQARSVNSPL